MKTRILWVTLAVIALVLSGCDSASTSSSPDGPGEPKLIDGAALSGSDQSGVEAVATHEEGEWLVAYDRENSGQITEAVYSTGEGNQAFIKFDEKGRPTTVVGEAYIWSFGNFNGNKADVSLLDVDTGEIRRFEKVGIGTDEYAQGSGKSNHNLDVEITPLEAAQSVGIAVTTFSCTAAAIPAPDSPFTAIGCAGGLLTTAILEGVDRSTEWGETAAWVGTGVDAVGCATGSAGSCVSAIAGASAQVLDDRESELEENEDAAQASGVARFGGVWNYQGIERGWFVMEEDRVYDAIYNSGEGCYDIIRLDFLEVDEGVFRYERRSDGEIIEAEFTLETEDVLKARRLSDNAEFKWNRDPSRDTQTFFDEECPSSNTSSKSKPFTH